MQLYISCQTDFLLNTPLTREASDRHGKAAMDLPVPSDWDTGGLIRHQLSSLLLGQHLCPPSPQFAPPSQSCDQVPQVLTPACTGTSRKLSMPRSKAEPITLGGRGGATRVSSSSRLAQDRPGFNKVPHPREPLNPGDNWNSSPYWALAFVNLSR